MSTYKKIQKVLVALIVGMLCAVPFWGSAQVEKGVTQAGESTKAISPVKPYVNEFGKLVCWPRVTSNGKLLVYGPIADTEDADEITATTAKLHGNILHDGWCNPSGVTVQGFELSLSADFTNIVKTVTLSPTPAFTPCATYPTCTCNDNKYSKTAEGLQPGTTYYYRAYATNSCGTGYGDTLNFKTDNEFVVTVDGPEEIMFCITGSEGAEYEATINPVISGATYQWYVDGTAVSGATSSTFTHTFTQADAGSHTVKCEVTAASLTRDGSKTTTVTVINPSVTFNSITGTTTICKGQTTTLTANASGSTGTTLEYQWQKNGVDIEGAYSDSYTTPALTESATYKCIVTAANIEYECYSDEAAKEVTVTVLDPTVTNVSVTPTTLNVCAGSTGTFTANATASSGATLSYQWKDKYGSSISGATSATFTTGEAGQYKCEITATQGSCSSTVTTNICTLKVITPTVGTIAVADQAICSGNSATLQANVTGFNGQLSYQWSTGGTNIPGAIYKDYETPELSANTTYTVYVTCTYTVTGSSSVSCTATGSASATVKIDGPYNIYDTLEVCDCQLPYTYNKNGWNETWTATAGENNYLTNPTRTRSLQTVAAHCDSILHITLITWSAANTVNTTCHNVVANAYGNETVVGGELVSIRDTDNNVYSVVQIGDQCWMKENLRVKRFADGRPLHASHTVSDGYQTNIYYTPASGTIRTKNVCDHVDYIPYDATYEQQYGLFYNWNTAMDNAYPADNMHNVQGICPNGWHLPDTAEWQTLERAAGFYGQHSETEHVFVGQSAIHLVTGCEWKQSTVTNSPGDYTAFGRNSLNFNVRPAGCFLDYAHDIDGYHYEANTVAYTGIWAFFWSSTRFHKKDANGVNNDQTYMHPDSIAAYNYDITYDEPGIARDVNGKDHQIGRSVRCVRDVSSMKVRINSKTETTSTSYTITGEVYDLGSTTCAERGVCYATHNHPTVSDTKVVATGTAGLGTYTCAVPVTSGVKYYVRAYAKDAVGNYVYSNEEETVPDVCPTSTVTDGDNNSYETIAIGTQCWTLRSIHTTKYADGTSIAEGSPASGDLYSLTTGYYYTPYINRGTLPGDAAARIQVWGYLYNWAAATRGESGNNVQGVCPTGWHIPTIEDWNTLDSYVKGHYSCDNGSAKALSSKNTWQGSMGTCDPGYDAEHTNNASGFNAYPAGIYNPAEGYSGSPINSSGNPTEPLRNGRFVNFWASNNNYYTALGYNLSDLQKNNTLPNWKQYAFSVRCVKN